MEEGNSLLPCGRSCFMMADNYAVESGASSVKPTALTVAIREGKIW